MAKISKRILASRLSTFGLFVEGSHERALRDEDELTKLWKRLSIEVGVERDAVRVVGFSKAQIVAMKPETGIVQVGAPSLDALVAIEYARSPFENLVVAFDAMPTNQHVLPSNCRPAEMLWLLERFANSRALAAQFKEAAKTLHAHYSAKPRPSPMGRGRPPRTCVEIVYMKPMFEALVLADESALRRTFKLGSVPKDWPSLARTSKPDLTFSKVIEIGKQLGTAPRHLAGVDFKGNKHGWALAVLEHASPKSGIWRHPIAARLAEVLAGP